MQAPLRCSATRVLKVVLRDGLFRLGRERTIRYDSNTKTLKRFENHRHLESEKRTAGRSPLYPQMGSLAQTVRPRGASTIELLHVASAACKPLYKRLSVLSVIGFNSATW